VKIREKVDFILRARAARTGEKRGLLKNLPVLASQWSYSCPHGI
jgi:hypothetical protein